MVKSQERWYPLLLKPKIYRVMTRSDGWKLGAGEDRWADDPEQKHQEYSYVSPWDSRSLSLEREYTHLCKVLKHHKAQWIMWNQLNSNEVINMCLGAQEGFLEGSKLKLVLKKLKQHVNKGEEIVKLYRQTFWARKDKLKVLSEDLKMVSAFPCFLQHFS